MATGRPSWASNLDSKGVYYEGLVEDVEWLLDQHKLSTVTTYGTRRSRKNHTTINSDSHKGKENKVTNYYYSLNTAD